MTGVPFHVGNKKIVQRIIFLKEITLTTMTDIAQMPDVGPDGRRYLASLVRSQAGVLIASVATLVLAAGCEVAVPHYSSKALNAAAFVGDRLVSSGWPLITCLSSLLPPHSLEEAFLSVEGVYRLERQLYHLEKRALCSLGKACYCPHTTCRSCVRVELSGAPLRA